MKPLDRYRRVRARTEALVAPLSCEDMVVQSMPDASPTKWHLAHTSWFFETFVLKRDPAYEEFDPAFAVLFNSYYNGIGAQFPRPRRGVLSRPTVDEVMRYRTHVDRAMVERMNSGVDDTVAGIVVLGTHHEEQHQELILTDLAHALSENPLFPAYIERELPGPSPSPRLDWLPWKGGVYEIGHAGDGFAFDNEGPRHRTFIDAFEIATRPVTNGDFAAFIDDGGYANHALWHSEGWALVQTRGWSAPAYWVEVDGQRHEFSLQGLAPLDPGRAVAHVSWFEAAAFAEWAGARLPTEAEWEVASRAAGSAGALLEDEVFHPSPLVQTSGALDSLFGDVWEWTASPYTPYPGFRAAPGAIGEYNGKFMANQYVLRGGSAFTPRDHLRASYRNFFPSDARWQLSGLRLAR